MYRTTCSSSKLAEEARTNIFVGYLQEILAQEEKGKEKETELGRKLLIYIGAVGEGRMEG